MCVSNPAWTCSVVLRAREPKSFGILWVRVRLDPSQMQSYARIRVLSHLPRPLLLVLPLALVALLRVGGAAFANPEDPRNCVNRKVPVSTMGHTPSMPPANAVIQPCPDPSALNPVMIRLRGLLRRLFDPRHPPLPQRRTHVFSGVSY